MGNRIIMIGPTTQNNTVVNGQSMMFQLVLDELRRRGQPVIVLDIGASAFSSSKDRTSGKFSISKLLDYILIIIRLFFILLLNIRQTVYVTTAQSKVGFIRDFFIIHLARLFRCKVIAHQFGANYGNFFLSQSVTMQKLITDTFSRAHTIVVEGNYTKDQFKFLPGYESKVYSLPNGLPEKVDSSKIEAKTIASGQPIYLFYLSNLIESKGYRDVLEAIHILVNIEKMSVYAVFAGKFLEAVDDTMFNNAADARAKFFSFVEKNGLEAHVYHCDGLFGAEKSKEFLKSHFFLLPSYYINEGQPVSVLEALAYGCVPIVTEYRLIPTMVNRDNGFFVNPRSPNEIAAVVRDLAVNNEKYNAYSKSGINTYLDRFTAEKYTDQLIQLLN